MTQLTLDTKVAHSHDVLSSSVDSEVVMANISTDKYYGLNPISAQIWQLLEQPKSLKEVCDALTNQYDVDTETCQSEVLTFVRKMVDARMLELV